MTPRIHIALISLGAARPRLGLERSTRAWCWRRLLPLAVCLVGLLAGLVSPSAAASGLQEIRYWSLGEVTRVVVQLDGEFSYRWNRLENPPRAFFDLPNVDLVLVKDARDRGRIRVIEVNDPILKQIRYAENSPGTARVVLDLNESCTITPSQLANPPRLVIELRTKKPSSPEVLVSRSGVVDAATALEEGLESEPETLTADSRITQSESAEVPAELPTASGHGGGLAQSGIDAAQPVVAIPVEAESAVSLPADPDPSSAGHTAVRTNAQMEEPMPLAGDAAPVVPAATVATVGTNQALSALPEAEGSPETSAQAVESAHLPETSSSVSEAIDSVSTGPQSERSQQGSSREIALAKPATRTVNGRQSLVRALGLKIGKVVIDPGHGGKDHGTTGIAGLKEKDLVLDISKRLAVLVQERLGAEVVLTREEDVFVPLEQRTAIANQHRADLFVSVHANSSPYKLAAGAETFFLNFTSSREAMDVAARENASAQRSVGELQDIVRRIALKDKRDESEDFAARVQKALFVKQRNEGIALKNRGVKAAPFIVLVGAEMPSILVEVGFLSNAKEEAAMKTPAYRQKLAEALAEGLETYMDSLSHLEGTERAAAQEQ